MKKFILNSITILRNITFYFLLIVLSFLVIIVFFHILNGEIFDFNKYVSMIYEDKKFFIYVLMVLFVIILLLKLHDGISKRRKNKL